MATTVENRVERLEARTAALEARLARYEERPIPLAAYALAATLMARRTPPGGLRVGLGAAAGITALYLASVALVTPFGPGAGTDPQALLSGLWASVGLAALLIGLVRDVRPLRLAALALLGSTAAKVFLYDLAALASLARVASFIVLGLLLLTAAFAWQRLRPGASVSPEAPA